MSGRIFCITGTDTGVGKTAVTCLLAAALRDRGLRVGVVKPVETGCAIGPAGRLYPADAALLRSYSGTRQSLDEVCPYALPDPLAPAVAAARAGTWIDFQYLCEHIRAVAEGHDVTLVEGAGGWLVPFTPHLTFADLVVALRAELVLVVANRLGALNHALLTVENARMRGVGVAGYVWNHPVPPLDIAQETNAEALRTWVGEPLGTVPHLAEGLPTPEIAASLAQQAIDLQKLLGER